MTQALETLAPDAGLEALQRVLDAGSGRHRRRRDRLPRTHHPCRSAQPSAPESVVSERLTCRRTGRARDPRFGTRAIHAGQSPDPTTGALMPPIYANSTYAQHSPGVHKGLDYGRSHNPTRWAFERCIADLESGAQAFAFASGLAAIATVLELLDTGAHVIAGDDLYGGTYRLLERVRRRSAGLSLQLRRSVRSGGARSGHPPETRMLLVETPTNPLLQAGRSGRRCRPSAAVTTSSPSPTTPSPARGSSARWNWASTSSCTRPPSI